MEFDLDQDSDSAPLDIAACDGPVRFQRILNPILTDTEDEETSGELDVVSEDDSSSQTNQNMELITPNKADSTSGATYKCLFCNHVFKSHYCYQKHKRRHLNPFTVDFTSVAAAAAEKKPVKQAPNNVLKDINVQFFPCKICGAKFPSYYFVHKHKKIWHPETVTTPTPSLEGMKQTL